jgi:hypothetical protein
MSISSLRSIIRDLIREVENDSEPTINEFCAVGAGGGALSAPAGGPQIMGHMSAPWAPVKSKKRRRLKRKLN